MGKAMGRRGYARKRDENEPGIIAALEAVGASVYSLDKPVDLLVGFRGIDFQLEVKNGNQPPSWQRVTDDQAEHLNTWQGRDPIIVTTMVEALNVIGCDPVIGGNALADLDGLYDEAGVPRQKPCQKSSQ